MYEPSLLTKLLKDKDLDALIKIDQVSDFIFAPKEYKDFFSTVVDHVSKYGEFPTEAYLDTYFNTERNSPLTEVWEQVKSTVEVDYPLMSVVDLQMTYNLRQNIISASHAVNVQLKSSNNSESNDIVKDFKDHINSLVSVTERLHSKEEELRGDSSVNSIKAYHEKTSSRGYYISKYGYGFIDEIQGGIERSGFIGILAAPKQRKSTLLRQFLYNQIIQGENAAIITLEMALESVREHLVVLHACNTTIWGVAHPYISITKVRTGVMTVEEKEFYYQVVDDLFNNPNYGRIFIKQPTGNYTYDNMVIDLTSLKAKGYNIAGVDYLALVKPSTKGRLDQDAYNDMIMNTRYLTLSLEMTLFTPIQANREGYTRAIKSKDAIPCYDLTAIHLYSAFEKGCTSIVSIIQTDEMRGLNQVAIGSVVNREAPPFTPTLMTLHNDSGTFMMGEIMTPASAMQMMQEIEI